LALTEHHIRAVCTSIIDSIVDKGECDFVVDIAAKLPTAVICEMMDILPRELGADVCHCEHVCRSL